MNCNWKRWLTIIVVLFTLPIKAQILGFVDDFENGSLDTTWNGTVNTLWYNDWYPTIFNLTESEGILQVAYNRTPADSIYPWPAFYFEPPEVIRVDHNPKIILSIRSDVDIQFAIKPVYSNGNDNYQATSIAGNNSWQTYTFNLSNYSGGNLDTIVFHFDGGSTPEKQGTVYFDNLIIAGFSISVSSLKAKYFPLSDSISLSWNCDNESGVDFYNVYRDTVSGFTCNSTTLIGTSDQTNYGDAEFKGNTIYYKVAAVDTSGKEHTPSSEVKVRTYAVGTIPSIQVVAINSDTVAKYEKLEIKFSMTDASYANEYDPDEIDVYSIFTSPGGETVRINAFYDNYNGVNEWKIRFAPFKVGAWSYQLFARDIDGTGASEIGSFWVNESNYHGCLKVSPVNQHYLVYHDDTPFYGVGAYYPWNVVNNANGLGILAQSGGNLFGYWNGNYDNAGNGGGVHQIESARTGIGCYDQDKCARIDEILSFAEQRNMEMMLAIWPHDVLDSTTWGYQGWEQNAFKEIVAAKEFYVDSLSWEYQKKLYRYIIARWGYSRSMGIWEFVNEINGTDGWYYPNVTAVRDWVQKIQDYFKENDPYNRPTTISRSGGPSNYWSEGYSICDLPNVHLYESGWRATYPKDPYRSSYWTYRNVTRQLVSQFDKPCIFGEAGASSSSMYASITNGSADYALVYHNAIWASWACGLATTPIWWSMSDRSLMTDIVFERMAAFSKVVKGINYAYINFQFSTIKVDSADAFLMEADTIGFGWARSWNDKDISYRLTRMNGLEDGTFQIQWYNTWSGDLMQLDTSVSVYEMLNSETPTTVDGRKDLAFKIYRIEDGTTAAKINLFFEKEIIQAATDSSYKVICFISDDQNRLCPGGSYTIDFSLTGPGQLSVNSIESSNGIGLIEYIPEEGQLGGFTITAQCAGLETAILAGEVLSNMTPNKDGTIPSQYTLRSNYPNPFNASTVIEYSLPRITKLRIDVYNLAGQYVETLVEGRQEPGYYRLDWSPKNLSSGIYFYRISSEDFTAIRKCVYVK